MRKPVMLVALACGALLVSLPAEAQNATPAAAAHAPADAPAASTPAPPAEKLTGAAAWERLKGNTIEGKSAGEAFSEYFDASGGVKYVDKDGASSGTWTVSGSKVCFDFPEDDDRSCSTFEVTGSTGTSRDDDGTVVRFTVLPGNAKGL